MLHFSLRVGLTTDMNVFRISLSFYSVPNRGHIYHDNLCKQVASVFPPSSQSQAELRINPKRPSLRNFENTTFFDKIGRFSPQLRKIETWKL